MTASATSTSTSTTTVIVIVAVFGIHIRKRGWSGIALGDCGPDSVDLDFSGQVTLLNRGGYCQSGQQGSEDD